MGYLEIGMRVLKALPQAEKLLLESDEALRLGGGARDFLVKEALLMAPTAHRSRTMANGFLNSVGVEAENPFLLKGITKFREAETVDADVARSIFDGTRMRFKSRPDMIFSRLETEKSNLENLSQIGSQEFAKKLPGWMNSEFSGPAILRVRGKDYATQTFLLNPQETAMLKNGDFTPLGGSRLADVPSSGVVDRLVLHGNNGRKAFFTSESGSLLSALKTDRQQLDVFARQLGGTVEVPLVSEGLIVERQLQPGILHNLITGKQSFSIPQSIDRIPSIRQRIAEIDRFLGQQTTESFQLRVPRAFGA